MFPAREGRKHGTKSTESPYAKIEHRFCAHAFDLTKLPSRVKSRANHVLNTNVAKVEQADHPSEADRLHIAAIFQGRPYKMLGCEVQ